MTTDPNDPTRRENYRGRSIRFHFVDVFATEPLTGNPLVVVQDADGLPDALMRRMAFEFNQSETTFVLSPTQRQADWRLRSFTPRGIEVFGAGGHNTLGAWWWLAASGAVSLRRDVSTFHQEIGDRVLPVTIVREGDRLTRVAMQQDRPRSGHQWSDALALASALGISAEDFHTQSAPGRVMSTGVAHLLVSVRNRDIVDRIRPDMQKLTLILERVAAEGCYIFSLDPRRAEASAYTRFFNPTIGSAEDPATGTAAGPLAAHLVQQRLAPEGVISIEQGTATGRTSVIHVDVRGDTVTVSAQAVIAASGRLLL
jgi:trans-2,3-dihydro-3-hydroxyanthranilate isomerase